MQIFKRDPTSYYKIFPINSNVVTGLHFRAWPQKLWCQVWLLLAICWQLPCISGHIEWESVSAPWKASVQKQCQINKQDYISVNYNKSLSDLKFLITTVMNDLKTELPIRVYKTVQTDELLSLPLLCEIRPSSRVESRSDVLVRLIAAF